MLLLKGADVNTVDNYGATALHYACAFGNVKLVELLLKYQANPIAKSSTFHVKLHGRFYQFSLTPKNVATKAAKIMPNDNYSTIIDILSYEERTREYTSCYNDLLKSRLFDYFINHPKLYSIDSILLLRRELKL